MKKSIDPLVCCSRGVATPIYTDYSIHKKSSFKISTITTDSKKITAYLTNLSCSNSYLSPNPFHFISVKTGDYLSNSSYDYLRFEINKSSRRPAKR